MQLYAITFFFFLIISIFVESVVILYLLRQVYGISDLEIQSKSILFTIAFGTALTLPYVWFIFPYSIGNMPIAIVIGELFAVVIEMFIYRNYLALSVKKAFIISLIANIASYGFGKALHYALNNF